MKKIIEIKKENDTLYVYWVLTDFCNYRCSYCPPNLNSGKIASTKSFPSVEDIRKFLSTIVSQQKQITVNVTGGEPTTHPMFAEIIKTLNDNGVFTETITNGSRPLAWWKKLESLPRMVLISLHPEFTDLSKINELGLFLRSAGSNVRFSLIADVNNWDWVLQAKEKLDPSLHSGVQARILTKHIGHKEDFGKLYEYTEEHFDFIKNTKASAPVVGGLRGTIFVKFEDGEVVTNLSGLDILNRDAHHFFGYACSAGEQIISVHPDGIVRAGICGVMTIGRLDNFKFLTKMIACTLPHCKCPADIEVSKFKRIRDQ